MLNSKSSGERLKGCRNKLYAPDRKGEILCKLSLPDGKAAIANYVLIWIKKCNFNCWYALATDDKC